ncbi:MFS transporter [Dactylosporangium matsuzakiense]|uniref:MFS transporter n=1 Tax=Dactylosporangium matsuzakiense TaxID=53360 RepID=A0A9W6NMH1_9ACTN|nr:MFS transporter [Dactylosporangium matsuzakiense]UWZ41553.1 MFS transporter [Dactylosporangium matsuzakiense]GLL02384.1 MFS transporter [Dactylosporangium matsuzakiense]
MTTNTADDALVSSTGAEERPRWTGAQLIVVLVIGTAALMVSLTQALLVPVLSELAVDLGAGGDGVAWVLTSTLLVGAVAVPAFGRLGDLFGTRRMLLVTVGALIAGSLICALAHNLTTMIIGRSVVGLAVAAVPLSISLIGVTLPRAHAPAGIALISAMLGVGGALGLPLAGLVAQYADYHWLFWICVAGGVLTVPGIVLLVKEPKRVAKGRMDLIGTVLLGAAMLALLLPLAQGASWGWTDPLTIGLLAAAVVLLVVFVLVELRRASPLVDVRTTARPSLLLTNIASLCVGFALFATLIGTASYVQAPAATGYGFGRSILVGGLCMLPGGIAMLLLSPFSARLRPRTALIIGSLIIAAGFVARIVLVDSLWQVVVGATISGAGTGIAYAAMPGLIIHAAPRAELAAANGLNALFRSVGSSLASAIGGGILAAMTITLAGHALPSLTGYRTLFAICAGAAVLAALLAVFIPAHAQDAEAALPDE